VDPVEDRGMTTHDFDFLVGRWDVRHRRLVKPLSGSREWDEFGGSWTNAWTYLEGAVSVDEIALPDRGFSGLSLRLRDAKTGEWSIWWVNSETSTLQPPVHGRWEDGGCRLVGTDEYDGKPILATYEWSDITEDTAHWQQSFSEDGGETWETNWHMDFRRASHEPRDEPGKHLPKRTGDFDFLRGRWKIHNRTLSNGEWRESVSTMESRTHHNGTVSVDEYVFPDRRALAFRTYDVANEKWSIYWVDSRLGTLLPPVHGTFANGVGEFAGDDELDGKPIKVRFSWTDIQPDSAHWQQAFSYDGGQTWETNWHMDLTRA
jgi:hypothetical protein